VLLQVVLAAQPQLHALVELGRLRCGVRVVEGVRVGLLGLGDAVTPDGRRPSHQVPAVEVVPGVDPLPRLLVRGKPGVQPPVDSCPVQVHEFLAVDPDTGDGGQALVQAHQHREVRVRQQGCLDTSKGRQRHGLAEEVLVEAVPAGKVLNGRGLG
jgi:hypothetical protein